VKIKIIVEYNDINLKYIVFFIFYLFINKIKYNFWILLLTIINIIIIIIDSYMFIPYSFRNATYTIILNWVVILEKKKWFK